MQKSFQDMATRSINARNAFLQVVEGMGFSRVEAVTIGDVYLHVGVLAFDPVDGQYYIRHGALMDKEPMKNALSGAAKALAGRKVVWKRR